MVKSTKVSEDPIEKELRMIRSEVDALRTRLSRVEIQAEITTLEEAPAVEAQRNTI